jgi:hypothetical protein
MGTMKGTMGTTNVCTGQGGPFLAALERRASIGIGWLAKNEANPFRVQAAQLPFSRTSLEPANIVR